LDTQPRGSRYIKQPEQDHPHETEGGKRGRPTIEFDQDSCLSINKKKGGGKKEKVKCVDPNRSHQGSDVQIEGAGTEEGVEHKDGLTSIPNLRGGKGV